MMPRVHVTGGRSLVAAASNASVPSAPGPVAPSERFHRYFTVPAPFVVILASNVITMDLPNPHSTPLLPGVATSETLVTANGGAVVVGAAVVVIEVVPATGGAGSSL